MLGKHHVQVNFAATAALIASAGYASQKLWKINTDISLLNILFGRGYTEHPIAYCIVSVFMLWLGSVLPDIDSETSIIGKKIHLPFKHRTWTHSFWALIPILIFACFFQPAKFLLIGYALHLIVDSVSASGICFTYPFKKYKEYSSGAFVAPNHKLKLYHTGKSSEKVFQVCVIIACCILCFLFRQGFNELF